MTTTGSARDKSAVSWDDRYTDSGRSVFLTGIQALVRLMLEQQRLDRSRGIATAAFVTGYEGSPLGGLDIELSRRKKLLDAHRIIHQPALNEELAATAIAGTQLAPDRPDARYQGVVGYWYGKTPGLDRASDALRHANFAGAHWHGGALALVGDDPMAKSSTMPGASERSLADLVIPTVYPADSQEIIALGLHAIAMSRASGLWSAMKIVTNVADGAGNAQIQADRPAPVLPDLLYRGRPFRHTVNTALLGPVPVEAEASAFGIRLDTAREYARLNGLNVLDSHGARDRIGIVAAGKSYLDVCQGLTSVGLGAAERELYGIRLLKLGLIFPLEPTAIDEFAHGLEEILVVEDKRAFLEAALKEHLYGRSDAPTIFGKLDSDGTTLLPAESELDADLVAAALARRLGERAEIEPVRAWLDRGLTREHRGLLAPAQATGGGVAPVTGRTPYFCSGCPHNTSTRVPEGSLVGAGIGCHTMVMLMSPTRVGEVVGLTQMGGEGAHWNGMAPFVDSDHLLQNLGDGTFHHSGSLAIRAAVAGGTNITYKLLYNSAVAMTGGQHAVGLRTVPELTELLHSEGVARVIVTTDEPRRYRRVRLAGDAVVWHRDRLEEAQRVLAGTPGVTVLIHDQQCAIEKRRQRKRNPPAKSEQRIVINERVCEGCGDCGEKSNCLSVEPRETEYGRKTQINQASCNLDYSCLKGDCPSFITVTNVGKPAKPARASAPATPVGLPAPVATVAGDEFTIRITGIGGTGVVTVSQIVANAAHIAGRHVHTLDQTGLSQKAGPVVSDIKVSRTARLQANKLSRGECDLYLGCDVLVAADPKNLVVAAPDRTISVVSTAEVPTGRMVTDPDAVAPDLAALRASIDAVTRVEAGTYLDARAVAKAAFGGDESANVVMLGAAYQAGALPLPLDALEQAIKLNGVAIDQNLRAFALGREAVLEDRAPGQSAGSPGRRARRHNATGSRIAAIVRAEEDSELARIVLDRSTELVAYQSAAYAESYARTVEHVRQAEAAQTTPGQSALAQAVARNLFKLMAYKDEYEVARLSLDPAMRQQIVSQFGPDARYAWRLHPPVLRSLGMRRKIALGQWAKPLFVVLRAGRCLRGTPFDLFGKSEVRRVERRLIDEYRTAIVGLLVDLHAGNHGLAVEIADLPDLVRGYEHIKLKNVGRYDVRLSELRARYEKSAC